MLRGFLFLFLGLAFLGLTALAWTDAPSEPPQEVTKQAIKKAESNRSPASLQARSIDIASSPR